MNLWRFHASTKNEKKNAFGKCANDAMKQSFGWKDKMFSQV